MSRLSKLLDFGIAKLLRDDGESTTELAVGVAVGIDADEDNVRDFRGARPLWLGIGY